MYPEGNNVFRRSACNLRSFDLKSLRHRVLARGRVAPKQLLLHRPKGSSSGTKRLRILSKHEYLCRNKPFYVSKYSDTLRYLRRLREQTSCKATSAMITMFVLNPSSLYQSTTTHSNTRQHSPTMRSGQPSPLSLADRVQKVKPVPITVK
jgi:hypothetical protein